MSGWVPVRSPGADVPRSEPPIFVGGPHRPDLGEEVLRIVQETTRSLTLVTPLVTEPALVEALLAARRRRVQVRLITEVRENRGDGVHYRTRGFEFDAGVAPGKHFAGTDVDLKKHFAAIRRLAGELVYCRGPRHYAHAKLLLSDDRVLMVSSANGTPNSLGRGGSPSLEAGARVMDGETVTGWGTALRSLWDACPFRLRVQGRDVSLQQESAVSLTGAELEAAPLASWSYPPGHRGLRNRLAELVQTAQRRVVLAALTFFETDKIPLLHEALEAALARNVEVMVIVRPEHFPPDRYPDPSTRRLMERGLRLSGFAGLHAKGILVDDTACGIFSANINPYSLECDLESANIEAGLFERAPLQSLAAYARFLEYLVAGRTHEYRP